MPAGQFGALLVPGPFAQSGLTALRCCVKTNVVPLLSARRTTVTLVSGSFRPGLAAAMAGSFHFVIRPRKISAYAFRDSRSGADSSGRLYARTTLPAVIGINCTPLSTLAISSSVIAASLAPKSTVLLVNCVMPAPLPTD